MTTRSFVEGLDAVRKQAGPAGCNVDPLFVRVLRGIITDVVWQTLHSAAARGVVPVFRIFACEMLLRSEKWPWDERHFLVHMRHGSGWPFQTVGLREPDGRFWSPIFGYLPIPPKGTIGAAGVQHTGEEVRPLPCFCGENMLALDSEYHLRLRAKV